MRQEEGTRLCLRPAPSGGAHHDMSALAPMNIQENLLDAKSCCFPATPSLTEYPGSSHHAISTECWGFPNTQISSLLKTGLVQNHLVAQSST